MLCAILDPILSSANLEEHLTRKVRQRNTITRSVAEVICTLLCTGLFVLF